MSSSSSSNAGSGGGAWRGREGGREGGKDQVGCPSHLPPLLSYTYLRACGPAHFITTTITTELPQQPSTHAWPASSCCAAAAADFRCRITARAKRERQAREGQDDNREDEQQEQAEPVALALRCHLEGGVESGEGRVKETRSIGPGALHASSTSSQRLTFSAFRQLSAPSRREFLPS